MLDLVKVSLTGLCTWEHPDGLSSDLYCVGSKRLHREVLQGHLLQDKSGGAGARREGQERLSGGRGSIAERTLYGELHAALGTLYLLSTLLSKSNYILHIVQRTTVRFAAQ